MSHGVSITGSSITFLHTQVLRAPLLVMATALAAHVSAATMKDSSASNPTQPARQAWCSAWTCSGRQASRDGRK